MMMMVTMGTKKMEETQREREMKMIKCGEDDGQRESENTSKHQVILSLSVCYTFLKGITEQRRMHGMSHPFLTD